MKKVLVIQTAFLGDVVLTTPFLRAILDRWPECEVDFMTTVEGAEILRGFSRVTVHALDKKRLGYLGSVRQAREQLRERGPFDAVLCVHRSPRSLVIGTLARARRRVAFRGFWSALLGYETVSYPAYDEATYYADKPFALLRDFGGGVRSKGPELHCAGDVPPMIQENDLRSGEYFVVSPFSVWGTKMWAPDRFSSVAIEVARKLNKKVVLIGGRSQLEDVGSRTITERIREAGVLVSNLVGATNLEELKWVIRGAHLVISNDSAPVHVAAAFDIPVVAIFGPTVRRWGFFPLSSRWAVVERRALECRPCSLHGPATCPKMHFRCMREIEVEHVVAAVENLLR